MLQQDPATAHQALLENFYSSFRVKDAEGMAVCYHKEAQFSDPIFPHLRGEQIGNMWRMLLQGNSPDFKLEVVQALADGAHGRAHWQAWYTFSGSGRRVHNIVRSQFLFRDGLIYQQHDRFDFWRWSRQTLGKPGLLLGWSSLLKQRVQRTAADRLERFNKRSAN